MRTGTDMKENGLIIKCMEKENIFGAVIIEKPQEPGKLVRKMVCTFLNKAQIKKNISGMMAA
jgi:hypothetical protein